MIAHARTNLRWVAPAAAAGLVIASPALLTAVATAEPTLPPRDADEIIASVLDGEPVAFTGEVVQSMDLGLPQLPRDAGVDLTIADAVWSLASGTNTWRLWYDGDRSYRVAIIRGQSESNLISNGSVMWAWSSQSQTAVRTELPPAETDNLPAPVESPAEAAKEVLGSIEQYSSVSTDSNVRVAGRAAYELVVTPTDTETRVAQVRVAVDAETSMPLRLQVFSSAANSPAVEIGFTKINYTTPNRSVFEFTPPPGAEVIEGQQRPENAPIPQLPQGESSGVPGDEVVPAGQPGQVIVGEGWSQVVVTPVPTQAQESGTAEPTRNPLADLLPRVSGDWGSGVVLDGTLVSIVLADDGRVAFGAVAPDALYRALAR